MTRWTLRAKLVALVLVLITTATVVIGSVTVLALRGSLIDQVDQQLQSASARTRTNAGAADRPNPGRPGPKATAPAFLNEPGTSEGTLGAVLHDGSVTSAATVGTSGASEPASAAVRAALSSIEVGTGARTYQLPGLGSYRVVATVTPGDQVLITGLPLATTESTQRALTMVVIGVGAVWLLVAGVAGSLLVRRTLRPLRDVAATAAQVARLPLDRGEVALGVRVPDADPRTEVGQVGSAVNAMLGHVERALELRQRSEQRVRGFVADASHELRTPLASIRGYAELTRRSREQVPPDVARALQRVESEAARMTLLVEDLLLLARLDAGPQVRREPVDLTRLVVDVVSDARVAGPDHHWKLELPGDPVVVDGDEQQLHQVVANLLANGRTHTPPGTTVTAALRVGGSTELTVTDDGPGIAAAVLPTVFERFARGESSRSRTNGSTGLGLAIVSSIVGAHGGSTDVESRPGRTVFTMRLPAATAPG